MRLPAAVIGVGASAGGVEALSTFLSRMPADIDAAVFVVLHVSSYGPSVLPGILARASRIPTEHGVDGERLRAGRIYVAPPDRHLTLAGDVVRVTNGPKENGVRPAIDVLFRSLATSYGPGATAVVLTGMLDDGTAGAREVKRAGGKVLVQDPAEAAFSAMPTSAAAFGDPDGVARLSELARLVVESVEARVRADERGPIVREGEVEPDEPSECTCPDCGGTLFVDTSSALPYFRCRVGHAYSPESLLVGKSAAVEAALWAAIVALEERVDLTRRMSRRMDRAGAPHSTRYRQKVDEMEQQADAIRDLLRAIKLGHAEDEQGSSP